MQFVYLFWNTDYRSNGFYGNKYVLIGDVSQNQEYCGFDLNFGLKQN